MKQLAQKISTHIADSELLSALARFKRQFLWIGLLSMLANLLALTPSLYMLQVFDRVMLSQNQWTLITLSCITLFLFGLLALTEWLRSTLLIRLGERIDGLLAHRIFDASFDASLQHADDYGVRSLSDLSGLRQFLSSGGTIAFFDAPWLPIYLLVLFLLSPLVGYIALFGAILLGVMAWLTERYTSEPFAVAQESAQKTDAFMQSKLRNAELVEAMGMLDGLRKRWENRHRNYLVRQSEAQDISHKIKCLTKFVRYCIQSLVLGAGALWVIEGHGSMWVIVVGNMLLGRALAPLDQAIGTWRNFVLARASYVRLDKLLKENPLLARQEIHAELRGEISVRQLLARVNGRDLPILNSIDLEFPSGETIAIIGPSGSGKSTLARAILGILPGATGAVLLDGEPLSSWSRDQLGPHVGYLPQNVQLFNGTIANNIARFGELDSERVIQAARVAGVHEMIQQLPQGYDTPVGVNGAYLSGGQRQRIGLARALYGAPRLVVLDEPNANLDDVGEKALQAAIQTLQAKACTVLVITHRTGVLSAANRILQLEQGRVKWYGLREDFVGV